MLSLVIAGAGGFGREALQYAYDCIGRGDAMRVRGLLDDSAEALLALRDPSLSLGGIASYQPAPDDRVVIAIGETESRLKVADSLRAKGVRFATVRHPLSYVAASAEVADGCILAPFSFVGPGAQLMNHVVLNTYASVGHDARIGECAVLSPYSAVNGSVSVGNGAFFGSGAVAVVGARIGERSKVAAGATVYGDVPDYALAVGNPARSRVMFRPSR